MEKANTTYTFLVLIVLSIVALTGLQARAGDRGVHLAISGMALTNSSEQGGKGPSGSTLLTHHDLVYHGSWWGLGAFSQYDKQGSNQTDFAVGPKMELHWSAFYVEGGWAPYLHRAFTDRSIARQTGNGWVFGGGVRVKLGGGGNASAGYSDGSSGTPSSGGFFLQFSYKYRIQNINKQDDTKLSEPIKQKDGYPLFGIGYVF